jgi:hypothetical protein
MDDLGRGGTAGGPPVNDIQLKNLRFYYTGDVANGDFVYIHELQNDNKYQGAVSLENIVIRSSQTSTPTNANFVGLHLQDVIGIGHRYVSVAYFGTGFKIDQTIWQGSHNVYERCMVGYCYNGVNYAGDVSAYTCETWLSPKIMHTSNIGFKAKGLRECLLLSPQFESLNNRAIESTCPHLVVQNGVFSSITGGDATGIYLYNNGNFWEVINCYFTNCSRGIYVWDNSTLYVYGNQYSGVTNPIYLGNTGPKVYGYDTSYVVRNGGTATFSGNGSQTTFTIAHGLAGTPKSWRVEAGSADAKGDKYVTADATNLTVTFATAPPSGTNNVVLVWQAEM